MKLSAIGYCRPYDRACVYSQGHGADGQVVCMADECPHVDEEGEDRNG